METGNIRLLVVDDDERNRDIMLRKFRRHGFDVLVAEGGERALEVVGERPVDLVILDIMMPGVDGIEVLRRLRRRYSPAQLPIIMATAKSDSQDIVQCAELGANDHIAKPLDFDVAVAKIRALLRLKAVASPAPNEPTFSELRAGAVLGGKYLLEGKIGAGAFGIVYKGRHQHLDLEIAVKVLHPRYSKGESLERFRREGVATCRLRHPNAVTVSDFGVTDTGVAFLVMELLEGRSLVQELRSLGKLSPWRTNQILQPICDVLAEAHGKDLVHRDIKPENIFLHQTSRGEVVKVLDFGIAKLLTEGGPQDTLTDRGWFVGTPAYTAPERFSGGDYDGLADVYSLGVMAFEMLTGQRPFRATGRGPLSVLVQHADKPPPTLRSVDPDLPRELEEPIALALRKDPRERPEAARFGQVFARSLPASEPEEITPEAGPQAAVAQAAVSQKVIPGDETLGATVAMAETVALEANQRSSPLAFLGRWLKKLESSMPWK